jgi:hypothetical protein
MKNKKNHLKKTKFDETEERILQAHNWQEMLECRLLSERIKPEHNVYYFSYLKFCLDS